ncbi:helix-turn-helix domain-containing protein [Stygiolobus caldivivus]|uniref:Bacterio-opsin activator n=1 Tax=Stygiolobus caldivivus TaxID=2824673 RepID=A0A8D5U710_9CREN|nr:helix-turn-helix domain-containing protein [Stygiolobus caldivivus]BCU70751.1 bacterio-opsin activator [Stygiolobus caldivivus]
MLLHVQLQTPIEEWARNLVYCKSSFSVLDIKLDNEEVKLFIELKGTFPQEFQNLFTKVDKDVYLGTLRVKSEIGKILSKYTIIQGYGIHDSLVWVLVLEGYQELRKLLREFIDSRIDVKVLKVVKAKSKSVITARQEQIVRIALEAGYYDYPRKVTLKKLAEKLNVSLSTLDEILRRAEKNIIETYLREKGL